MIRNAPTLGGFGASSQASEGLSPQQSISQFGLDYKDSDYIQKDAEGKVTRQPFIYSVESPMTPDIKKKAKVPLDPRDLARLIELEQDPNTPEETRQKIKQFLDDNKDKIVLIPVEGKGDATKLDAAKKSIEGRLGKLPEKDPKSGPYTGKGAPLPGSDLKGEFADVRQERYLESPAEIAPGTKMYAEFPKEGSDPERSDNPVGADKVPLAEWDGEKWNVLATEADLDKRFDRVLKDYPPDVKKKFEKEVARTKQLKDWKNKGDWERINRLLGILEDHIKKHPRQIQDGIDGQNSKRRRKKRRKRRKKTGAAR